MRAHSRSGHWLAVSPGSLQTLGILIVLRIIMGVGESIYLPGGMKAVSLFFDAKDRGLASGLVNCGTSGWIGPRSASHRRDRGRRRLEEHLSLMRGLSSLAWLIPWLNIYPWPHPFRFPGVEGHPRQSSTWIDSNLLALSGREFLLRLLLVPAGDLASRLPGGVAASASPTAGAYAAIPYLIYVDRRAPGGLDGRSVGALRLE